MWLLGVIPLTTESLLSQTGSVHLSLRHTRAYHTVFAFPREPIWMQLPSSEKGVNLVQIQEQAGAVLCSVTVQSEVCRGSANSAQLSDTSTESSTAKLAARSGLAEEPCVLTVHKQHFNQSQVSTSHKLCSLGFGWNLGSFSRYTQTHLLG